MEVNRRIQFMKMNIHTALKRTLSVVALMAMTLGAWADGENATNVAKIGDTEYATLQAAVDEAGEGATITLLSDVSCVVTCENANNFTIDMDGKTWSYLAETTNESWAAFRQKSTGTVTLKNGSITTKVAFNVWASSGKVIIENGTYTCNTNDNYNVYVNGTGVVEIKGGTFTNSNTDPYIYNSALKSLNLNVENSLVPVDHIKVYGGTFTADPSKGDDAQWGTSTFVVSGYVVKTNSGAPTTYKVEPKVDTEVSLPNEATDDQKTAANVLASNTSTGTVTGLGDNESLTISITGVTVNNGNATSATFDVTFKDASCASQSTSSSSITFRLPVSSGIDANKWANLAHSGTPITGTTVQADSNGNKYIEITTTSFSPFSYEILSNNPVVKIGETKYATLQDAVNAAGTTATTITLLADASENITIPNDANITLAVGEYTVSGNITCGGTLTITDGKFTGTITNSSGTVAISGGTFSNPPAANCCATGYIPVTNLDGTYGMHNQWTINDSGNDFILPTYLANKGYKVGTATYNRQTGMAAVGSDAGTKYGTICLPFEIKALPTGMTLYKAKNIEGNTLTIEGVTATSEAPIAAGTPLIFELTNAATSISITSKNATVNTAEPTTSADNILVGTYIQKTISTGLTNIFYLNGDKFHNATSSLTVPAYRAYLVDDDTSRVKGEWLTISTGDEETAISSMDIDENTVVAVYDLNGRKQSALQRGLNIVRRADGSTMKVIVK